MGTKIQANNAFFGKYHSVIDLDGSTRNGIMSSLYILQNDPLCKHGYLIPHKVRQTILEHESIFRNQLQELHRLYGRQQVLMNEIKKREMDKDTRNLMNYEPMLSKKGTLGNRNNESYDRDSMLSLCSVQTAHRDADANFKFNLCFKRTNHLSANSCSNLNLVTKDFFQSSMRSEMNGNELISDDYAGRRIFDKHSSMAFPQSLLAEPKEEFVNCPLDLNTSVSQRKSKLFGVEISGGNDVVSFEASSWIDNSFMKNLECKNERSKADLIGLNFVKEPYTVNDQRKHLKDSDDMKTKPTEVLKIAQHHIFPSDCKSNQENPKTGGLPWFLRNPQVSNDQNKEKKSCYFMNLDSLQNCSDKFFKKAETADVTFPTPQRKNEISGIDEDDAPKNNPERKDHILNKGLNNYISEMRYQIDLNLSLDEEDAPSLPKAVVKIATTEMDLEAPAVIESETDRSHEDKIAAEAIIAMSLSERKNPVNAGASDLSMDRLKCFAEIVSSYILPEDSIPVGMDYFEYMTLKLVDTKEEVPHYELTNCIDQSKRSRRGRQRKDFKRDILPGLVTLSRVEVTEDLQAFDELLKAKGDNLKLGLSQRSSNRNGKGRKRSVISPARKEVCRPPLNQPICQLEERSLTGWGKRTRRLPRQRCNNAFLSCAVKC